MKGLANLSPLQLVCLSVSGSIAPGAFYLLPVGSESHLRLAWIALYVAVLAAGILLAFRVPIQLESGIANQRWSAVEVRKVRSIVDSPAVKILLVVLFAASASLAFQHGKMRHFANCFYPPILAITQLLKACREPKPQSPLERINSQSVALRSEHWGER